MIELVINISEESYKNIKEQVDKRDYPDMQIGRAIADGVPLPKGHGRLIDADVLGEKLNRYTEAPYQYALAVFNESPTIIKAR